MTRRYGAGILRAITVKVVLQYFDGCPSWRVAEERLRSALVAVGLDPSISHEEISTLEEAERVGFIGSPTILINGRDPFRHDAAVPGLACRRYSTDRGIDGAPSVAQLVDALRDV
jgi:hypothetical protein